MVLTTYGRSSGFCVDPIEKKPLNHYYPGTSVLSFGTAGCNLSCKFCQNWDISKSRQMDRLADSASPEAIARAAKESGCKSVAFTYNDPVIFAEYAMDTADACHALGLQAVAVTAGDIAPRVPHREGRRHPPRLRRQRPRSRGRRNVLSRLRRRRDRPRLVQHPLVQARRPRPLRRLQDADPRPIRGFQGRFRPPPP